VAQEDAIHELEKNPKAYKGKQLYELHQMMTAQHYASESESGFHDAAILLAFVSVDYRNQILRHKQN
jgi:hypothetical protein